MRAIALLFLLLPISALAWPPAEPYCDTYRAFLVKTVTGLKQGAPPPSSLALPREWRSAAKFIYAVPQSYRFDSWIEEEISDCQRREKTWPLVNPWADGTERTQAIVDHANHIRALADALTSRADENTVGALANAFFRYAGALRAEHGRLTADDAQAVDLMAVTRSAELVSAAMRDALTAVESSSPEIVRMIRFYSDAAQRIAARFHALASGPASSDH